MILFKKKSPGLLSLLLKLLANGCRFLLRTSARGLCGGLLCKSVFVGVERHKLMLARRPARDHECSVTR